MLDFHLKSLPTKSLVGLLGKGGKCLCALPLPYLLLWAWLSPWAQHAWGGKRLDWTE